MPDGEAWKARLKQLARLPKWKFIRREAPVLFAALTVGLPFVGYKLFAGVILWRMYAEPWAYVCGGLLFLLGVIDFCLHMINFYAMCCFGRRFYPVCLLAVINKQLPFFEQKQEIGEAVDTMLSFAIVACVVGNGLYVHLDAWQGRLWNACTVVNVLGAGLSQLQATFFAEREKRLTE